MSAQIDLARKIKALADQGYGGESSNAAALLEKLCHRYGINILDLEKEDLIDREFKIRSDEHLRFVGQVISSIVGDRPTYRYKRRKNSPIIVGMTDSEFIEASAKIEFYWKDFLDQREIFYRAYIQRQHLYIKDSDSRPNRELSVQELEQIERIFEMEEAIKRKTFVKQLNSKNGLD